MIPRNCDVAVIGGGPAGSSAAALLAQQGHDVVLLEKARHPRNVVGESVIPHFWRYADRIGITEAILGEKFLSKSGGTVAWDGHVRQMSFRDFGFTRSGMHVERDRFDQLFLNHARNSGARVFEEVVVDSPTRLDESGGDLPYRSLLDGTSGSLSARYVIDASGQASCIARARSQRQIDPDFRFTSIWGYFNGGQYVAEGGQIHPVEDLRQVWPSTFVSSIGRTGWSWHIPLRSSTSVGLVLPLESLKDMGVQGQQMEKFFLEQCRSLPYLKNLLRQADYVPGSMRAIRDYSFRVDSAAGPGYFLIGDAGGFIDPIFSLGVVLAVFSATAAAWLVGRCFKRPDRASSYQAFYSELTARRLNLARALALPLPSAEMGNLDELRDLMHFHSNEEQELFQVVSLLTNRSSNFQEIAGCATVPDSLHCTEIDKLHWA